MAQIIGAELHLETVLRLLPLRQRHHAGIVDEEVELLIAGGKAPGEIGHGGETCEIEMLVGDQRIGKPVANALDRPQALCVVAPGEYDDGTGARQRQRRLVAEAARGPGDDGGLAAEEGMSAVVQSVMPYLQLSGCERAPRPV